MPARRHSALIPLSHDHREALALVFRLHHPAPPGPVTAMTPASTPQSRARETIEFFEANLLTHFRAEEEALFAALEEDLPPGAWAHELLRRLRVEHELLRRQKEAIESAADGARLGHQLTAFADLLEQHVRTEERQLFAEFESLVDRPAAAERIGQEVSAILRTRRPRHRDR